MKKEKLSAFAFYRFLFIVHCSLFIVLFSCRTAPVIQELSPDMAGIIPLEPGGLAYIFTDTKKAGPILEHLNIAGLDQKQFQQISDMIDYVATAVYPPESGKRFRIAARGRYPVSKLKLALGTNKDWKKYRSPATKSVYWYSFKMKLSVAFNPAQAIVLSTNDFLNIDPYNTLGTEVPEGFGEFTKGAILSCWLDDPGPLIDKKLEETGIPLQLPAKQIFISLFPSMPQDENHGDRLYQANIKIRFSGEIQARSVGVILALARNFLPPDLPLDGPAALAAILFANPPVQEGIDLNIKTNTLSDREVALLFNIFSL